MAYPQSTLEEIVDSERSMVLDGEARYGRHFTLAKTATMYLSVCVISVEHDRSDTFGRLFSLIKKHHALAFLSALRLHKVQAMINLRQVLEAGVGAAYAIANPDVRGFADIDAFGIMDPSKKLSKHYKWLDQNYPDPSQWIKETKGKINDQAAHANIVSAHATFRGGQTSAAVSMPFFDVEDDDFVQADLWLIGHAAIRLMDLFYLVTKEVARTTGQSPLEFRTDFPDALPALAAETNGLLDEIKGSDRYKTAMRKQKERREAKTKLADETTTDSDIADR
jgi:hypothetical protein